MDERLLARLSTLLRTQPVVLASVEHTRGATPRKAGSRMLVCATHAEFSIGGGMAEVRVLEAARALLAQAHPGKRVGATRQGQASAAQAEPGAVAAHVDIDLTGRAGAAGVCGGSMRIGLRRWAGAHDQARAAEAAQRLRAGMEVQLRTGQLLRPDPRLLIVGAGHCGLALHQLARFLDYDAWVFDSRAECFAGDVFSGATVLCGDVSLLQQARATQRSLDVVLLNRDYAADVAALRVLCAAGPPGDPLQGPRFLGMMGSSKRIAEVGAALAPLGAHLQHLVAPVGIDIGAQTPHEIAVSILAQLVAVRSAQPQRS